MYKNQIESHAETDEPAALRTLNRSSNRSWDGGDFFPVAWPFRCCSNMTDILPCLPPMLTFHPGKTSASMPITKTWWNGKPKRKVWPLVELSLVTESAKSLRTLHALKATTARSVL